MSAGSATQLEPVEALLAHVLRQHRDAAAAEDARDGDAAAAVIAGRRPDRAVARRIELAGDDARREAAVGGEHLVGADHRESDCRARARCAPSTPVSCWRQFDRAGHVARPAAGVVEPMDAEQIERVGRVRVDVAQGVPRRRSGSSTGPSTRAKVGSTTPAWRKRAAVRFNTSASTTLRSSPRRAIPRSLFVGQLLSACAGVGPLAR